VGGRYAEFPPRADLAAHVACVWTFESQEADREDQRVLPDGCCELILHCGVPHLEYSGGRLRPQPQALFAGQLSRPLRLRGRAGAEVVGIRFHPAGAFAYVGAPLAGFTDRRAPLDTLLGPEAVNDLVTMARSVRGPARLERVQDHVASVIAANGGARDLLVEAAVAALACGGGLQALRKDGQSARALQRRFARVVGLPPRSLAAVFRLRRLFEALHDPEVGSWTAAAQAAGYFDHPQMAREVKRYLGCSPSAFVAADPGLASSLADLPR
jgi:hypothetical protein